MAIYETRNGNIYRAAEVVCPFWRGADAKRVICCEGLTDNSQIITRHNRKNDHDIYMDLHCTADYTACPVHTMLMREKYGG